MILHKKTLAVSTAALLMTGGAAYAFITATTVGGNGSVTAQKVNSAVSLYTDPNVTLDPINLGADQTVDVFADNTTNVSLGLPVTIPVKVDPIPGCPAGSFTVSWTVATAPSVPKTTTKFKVGTLKVAFVDNPDPLSPPQDGCSGASVPIVFG